MSAPLLRAHGLGRLLPRAGHPTAPRQSSQPPSSRRWLIHGVSLDLKGGDRLAILGASGSGKTVLLRALALIDACDRGMLHWRGEELSGPAVPCYRARAIYLHQSPALADLTVEGILKLPFGFKSHRDHRYRRERALELLAMVGRQEDFLEKSRADLSGGEAQLAALVRALLLEPQVLFLDEPTAALDPETAAAVERVIGRWLAENRQGRAYVWVSHDLEQAERIAGRLLTMDRGELI